MCVGVGENVCGGEGSEGSVIISVSMDLSNTNLLLYHLVCRSHILDVKST